MPAKSRLSIDEVRRRLADAASVVVLSGAGISAESGVPTYRGAGGLWKNFRAQDLATLEAFDRDPALVWGWYRNRRRALLDCKPNPAHRALAAAAENPERELIVITQNIDGLHTIAGLANPLEIHGNIWREKCVRCRYRVDRTSDYNARRVPAEDAPPPKCPGCDDLLRPDVVWFGEQLDPLLLDSAFRAAEACDVMLVIGTSCEVHPAALIPLVARKAGACLVEVNLEPTPLTNRCDASIFAPAGQTVPELFA